jgi:alanine racemase
LEHDLTLSIPSPDYVPALEGAARQAKRRARVHVKIDTGMTRLGLDSGSAMQEILHLARNPQIEIEGIYTHLATADEPHARGKQNWGSEFARGQLDTFLKIARELERAGLTVKYRHAANSAGAIQYRDGALNLVRTGILLYGLHPSGDLPRPANFRPALAFKTKIAMVRDVPPGRFVSYGATFETKRHSRVGVLMVGYADGFRRGPQHYGQVLVHGKRAPIIGRVCMDQTMIDVTDIPEAQTEDEVVLLGKQGGEEISAEDVASNLGTNNYEAVTTISARVPRLYK